MSTLNVDRIVDSSGGVLSPISSVFKNRIINGGMVLDQRNAGASVTGNDNVYGVDRFRVQVSQSSKFTMQQNAGSVTPPTGFRNYLGITSSAATSVGSSDYFILQQRIEGFNTADLMWGTTNAKTITLSFWVRSSLTGTFGGSLQNDSQDRSYPFTYTISVADTWEYKTITIAGDTSGTWLTTNGMGIKVVWGLGVGSTFSGTAGAWNSNNNFSATGATSVVGTNGATFYITGVQLEVGTQATSFEYRQFGTELTLCQRYFERSYNIGTAIGTFGAGFSSTTLQNSTEGPSGVIFKVTKRTGPTMVMYNAVSGATGAMYRVSDAASVATTFDQIGTNQIGIVRPSSASANSYYLHWTASAEL
jgi:hypothetical protein